MKTKHLVDAAFLAPLLPVLNVALTLLSILILTNTTLLVLFHYVQRVLNWYLIFWSISLKQCWLARRYILNGILLPILSVLKHVVKPHLCVGLLCQLIRKPYFMNHHCYMGVSKLMPMVVKGISFNKPLKNFCKKITRSNIFVEIINLMKP